MPTHRLRPRGHRSARLLLAAGRGAALGGLLTVLVLQGSSLLPSAGDDSAVPAAELAYREVVERAVLDHRCSYTGLDGEIPSSALIRTARGEVRQVTFDVGWDVYNGRRPGTLVAVCLDEPPTARRLAG